jgi:hypothetical protein
MDVFDVFQQSSYTFLKLSMGGILGNAIIDSYDAQGVYKEREGMVVNNNIETKTADATLHIKPAEQFVHDLDGYLVGHGVHVNGRDYRIIGQTGGQNYHSGSLEHIRVTLKRERLDHGESS